MDSEQTDITGAAIVEVRVRADGRVLWVNVDGICRLRVCQIDQIEVEDERSIPISDN
jgi:Lon protease-like protein